MKNGKFGGRKGRTEAEKAERQGALELSFASSASSRSLRPNKGKYHFSNLLNFGEHRNQVISKDLVLE